MQIGVYDESRFKGGEMEGGSSDSQHYEMIFFCERRPSADFRVNVRLLSSIVQSIKVTS